MGKYNLKGIKFSTVMCTGCNQYFKYNQHIQTRCPRCNLEYVTDHVPEPEPEPLPEPVHAVENREPIRTLRETFRWGTFGRYGDEEIRPIILKEISDSHLAHIIGHLILTRRTDTLITMLEEARYRSLHNIFVPDYDNQDEYDDDEDLGPN